MWIKTVSIDSPDADGEWREVNAFLHVRRTFHWSEAAEELAHVTPKGHMIISYSYSAPRTFCHAKGKSQTEK